MQGPCRLPPFACWRFFWWRKVRMIDASGGGLSSPSLTSPKRLPLINISPFAPTLPSLACHRIRSSSTSSLAQHTSATPGSGQPSSRELRRKRPTRWPCRSPRPPVFTTTSSDHDLALSSFPRVVCAVLYQQTRPPDIPICQSRLTTVAQREPRAKSPTCLRSPTRSGPATMLPVRKTPTTNSSCPANLLTHSVCSRSRCAVRQAPTRRHREPAGPDRRADASRSRGGLQSAPGRDSAGR